MENDVNWFNVFNADEGTWLQETLKSWGSYAGAAEFATLEIARGVAKRAMREKPEATIIVLGDFGLPE